MATDRPTLSPQHQDFLRQLFPGEDCLLAEERVAPFGVDASRLHAAPLAVVRPSGDDAVRQAGELLRWAHAERVPLYFRGRATNVVGDCVPEPPGIVVSTLKMNRILEIDEDDFVAVVEPGVVAGEFQSAVEARGLFYPPDPASVGIATLGGNAATCAGGMRAVKYGVTRDWVLGMELIVPGGEVLQLGTRTHKNVVGLDLTRLVVGSEGTLGFASKLILKLMPKPEASASLFTGFADRASAMAAIRAVFRAGALPTALEFMNSTTLKCLEMIGISLWPEGTDATLLFKVDGAAAGLEQELNRLQAAVETADPLFVERGTGEDEERLWKARRSLNPASYAIRPNKSSDDVTLPRGKVGAAVDAIEALEREIGVPILQFGHLGDGNLHVNIMYDAEQPEEQAVVQPTKERITDLVLSLGGSLSGEHGTGLTKRPYVDRQLGEGERALMRAVKAAFDPHNILNPGKFV